MVSTATKKATAIPKSKINICAPVNTKPCFTIFKRLAPNMTGMPKKNENSAATALEQPSSMAPSIVAPDLEVPGISERHWKTPINAAVL